MNKVDSKKSTVDLSKLIEKARLAYGKDQSLAMQISTGSSISRPSKDTDFVCWANSPWQTLTGIRGIPFGRVVQIAGRPDSGKSTHAMQFMKLAQDQNVLVVLWDSERKFSAYRFDNYFGGDSNNMLIVNSNMILQGGDQVEKLVHAAMEDNPNRKILIVWDSVGGTLAQNEEENSLNNSKQMAASSKENGAVLRAFVRLMEKYKKRQSNEEMIAVLLINQSYANIGAPGQKESGGQKVEYFSSIILQLTRKEDLTKMQKGVKIKTGIVTRAKVKKNHLFDGEFSVAELDLTITAGGIGLLSDRKIKKSSTAPGASTWDALDNGEIEEEAED